MQAVDETETTPSLPALMANTLSNLVDSIAAVDRMIAALSAQRADLIEQARQWCEATAAPASAGAWSAQHVAQRELVAELACALRVPEHTAESLIAESKSLVGELPATNQALQFGLISYRHAQVMIDQASSLPNEARSGFELAALPFAKKLTVAKFNRKARIPHETRHDNLAHLCRSHHNVKHHTSWQARQRDGGRIEWISPAGKSYSTEPATQLYA
jgi:hypothetical protein